MSDWDYGRCKGFVEEVVDFATQLAVKLERYERDSCPWGEVLRDVSRIADPLKKVKALLVRERRSRA